MMAQNWAVTTMRIHHIAQAVEALNNLVLFERAVNQQMPFWYTESIDHADEIMNGIQDAIKGENDGTG